MKSLLFFLLSFSAYAHESKILSSYFLSNPDAGTLATVSKYFDSEYRQGRSVLVIVSQEEVALLKAIAPDALLREANLKEADQKILKQWNQQKNHISTKYFYHSFSEVLAWMENKKNEFPQIASIIEYGLSQQKKPLRAIRINSSSTPRPALLFTAATHGDELITTEILIELVNRLLHGYGKDSRITKMIDEHDLYFVPVVNADGFSETDRYDNNRDPNRSYPFPNNPNNKPTTSIEAVIKLFVEKNIVGSIDFHAYGELIMYPWAYTHEPVEPAYAQAFHSLTGHMAQANNYTFGPISDVIYVAPGSSADFYFWQKKTLSLGIEIGHTKIPDPAEFPENFKSQEESTWRFIESFRE